MCCPGSLLLQRIPQLLCLKIGVMIIDLLCQLSDVDTRNPCPADGLHREFLNLPGIIFQNDAYTCLIPAQLEVVNLFDKAGKGAVTIVPHVEIRIFLEKGAPDLPQTGIPSIIFIGIDNLYDSVRNLLFLHHIFLDLFFLAVVVRLRQKLNISKD